MAGDATPPSSPPPPAPELPPGLLAEYLESARAQLGVLAGLAERLAAAARHPDAPDALRPETHQSYGSRRPGRDQERRRPPGGPGASAHGLGPPPPRPRTRA